MARGYVICHRIDDPEFRERICEALRGGASFAQVARELGVTDRTLYRHARRYPEITEARAESYPPPHIPRHGTTTEYSKWGCRCEDCTRANREAHRDYMARRRAA